MAKFGVQQRGREPQEFAVDDTRKIAIQTRVSPATRAKAITAANHLGISLSALVAELLERLEVDESGRPGFESKYAALPDGSQPELEMSA